MIKFSPEFLKAHLKELSMELLTEALREQGCALLVISKNDIEGAEFAYDDESGEGICLGQIPLEDAQGIAHNIEKGWEGLMERVWEVVDAAAFEFSKDDAYQPISEEE